MSNKVYRLRKKALLLLPVLLLIFIFAYLSLRTLPDYGVNWDSSAHFIRGQIYLRFFLTGKKDTPRPGETTRMSYYRSGVLDWNWVDKMTIGHPPLSDILEAATNRIFWGKFGLIGDVESYHLFVVLVSIFMVVMIGIWSYITYGGVASFFSVLTIVTIPFFFAEQHFNIKDPPVAAYYTGALFFLWLSAEYKKIWPVLVSALFFGISLGTKFNIIFSVFILIPWAISLQFWKNQKMRKIALIAVITIPVVSLGLLFITYPAIWSAPVQRTLSVIQFYRTVGSGYTYCPYYKGTLLWALQCFNRMTVKFIIGTLPLPTLLLFVVGSIIAWKYAFRKSAAAFLWLVWVIETTGRVILPFTTLYGGIPRQIMEYIVPLSLLSGLGASYLVRSIKTWPIRILILLCFTIFYIPVVVSMMKLHPFENVYFNSIVGGLSGAIRHRMEGANNTYGNALKQGAEWLNLHAEKNAEVTTGALAIVPGLYFRNDLTLYEISRDLYDQNGEYVMQLAYPGMNVDSFYLTRYMKNLLKPVYLLSVDHIPLLYIWKNDPKHLKPGVNMGNEQIVSVKRQDVNSGEVMLTFDKSILKRMEFTYASPTCKQVVNTLMIFASEDLNSWSWLWGAPENFADFVSSYRSADDIYQFAGDRFIGLKLRAQHIDEKCPLSDVSVKLFAFP